MTDQLPDPLTPAACDLRGLATSIFFNDGTGAPGGEIQTLAARRHPFIGLMGGLNMATKRIALSKKTRFEVFKRDGFICQYCGAHPPSVVLHVDHITAVAAGGTNDQDNLVTACEPCNAGKGARDLNVVPKSLDAKAAEVAEREEQLRGYQEVLEGKRQRLEGETWQVLNLMYPSAESVPRDHFNSTRNFIEKLGLYPVREAAETALASSASYRNMFRYFCGVCWNKVREVKG